MHSNQPGSSKITSETRDKNEKSDFKSLNGRLKKTDLQQSFSGRSLSLSLSPFFQTMRRKNSQQRGFLGRIYRWWKSVLVLVLWMEQCEKKLGEHNRRPQQKHLSSNAKKKEAPQFKKNRKKYLGSNFKLKSRSPSLSSNKNPAFPFLALEWK